MKTNKSIAFFDCPAAHSAPSMLQARVRPGGIAVVNVLVEGTTYLDMFEPGHYCLFGRKPEHQAA